MPCKVCGGTRQLTTPFRPAEGIIEFLCWRCLVAVTTGRIPPEYRK